jgi:hypothetical protein
MHMCICATHHAFEHEPCLSVSRTVASPTARAGFAITKQGDEDKSDNKADYDVHGITF